MNLYNEYADEFSKTRTSKWKGWDNISRYIEDRDIKNLNVLDIACGNGRFLDYLSRFNTINYIGIDNSDKLLTIAKSKASLLEINSKFLKIDLNNLNWLESLDSINNLNSTEFNIIVAFGITHHIKSIVELNYLYESVNSLLNNNGIFIISYWQFATLDRYKKKMVDIGDNTYQLPFGKNGATRVCKYFNSDDILKVENSIKENNGFTLKDFYLNDGRENNENLYKVYYK